MTEKEYYAVTRSLGLTPTQSPTFVVDSDRMMHNVPDPANKIPAQRAEIIALKKSQRGV